MANTKLVIVESPAKARTIEKYLGSDYRVLASMGHLRDLPKSTMGVDPANDFAVQYIPVKGREDIIDLLKKAAKSAKVVYLATDPDREGEAISWHLKELLDLPDEKARRVTFNEITKRVVTESIEQPRDIDQNLVDAQQARRVLDRIVGYELSPFLWKKVKKGLSAGRVQSVATRMVLDRERDIRAFVPEEYWLLDADLARTEKSGSFTARFYGTEKRKAELHSEEATMEVWNAVEKSPFVISNVVKGEKRRSPAPPFITSTLQQEASRRLGMTPRRTMSIAQQLYEGVDISGEGTVGLITYMRTDSLRLSEDALASAGKYIKERYGDSYYPGKPRRFKTGKSAQDAHEAIRPSVVTLDPERVRKDLTIEQYRLYRLIWGRFLTSQMANAVYDSLTINAESAGYVFRANHSELRFAGYTAVYEEGRDEDGEDKQSPLPDLREGEVVQLVKLKKEQKFTQPPTRYTEATLIRAMEEKGIGRPSTYAPTISTILSRQYVRKEGKYLCPTNLGETVTELMEDCFSDIVDLKFTAGMEDKLDHVEEGKVRWKSILSDFYGGFSEEMREAERKLEGKRIRVPDEVSEEICPVCGKNLVVKNGRFGPFLACPGFPECTFSMPLVVEMPGACPACGGRILKRTSKKGNTYYACEKGRDCTYRGVGADGQEIVGFMTWDVPVKDNCPSCGKTMFKKSGRGAKKPFCINEECPDFVPVEKRGGYTKKTASSSKKAGATEKAPAKKQATKKTAAGKADAEKK
ncbi:MAG: type I DNA topoisomerase [Oscillospiraceae bacterium]|nr:type I DNA topoisomerase [Oscillospiraceae bacterium]